jgi:mRNA degradation ribonuclease J1/J2
VEVEDKTNPGVARLTTPRDGCVEVVFEGDMDGAVVETAVSRLRAIAEQRVVLYLLVDGTGITKYDSSVRDQGKELLSVVRDCGGREVVMVLSSAVHRLLGATVAMMVRIPIKIFGSRAQALDYIERESASFFGA